MPPTDLTAAVPAPDFTAYQAETVGIVLDSLAPATRRAYRIALAAVDDWHAGRSMRGQAGEARGISGSSTGRDRNGLDGNGWLGRTGCTADGR